MLSVRENYCPDQVIFQERAISPHHNNYNQYMGGVDIADQLWAGFSTQQHRVKPWKPLFYWLLDTLIINAFHLLEH
jgi:hypothetical protein